MVNQYTCEAFNSLDFLCKLNSECRLKDVQLEIPCHIVNDKSTNLKNPIKVCFFTVKPCTILHMIINANIIHNVITHFYNKLELHMYILPNKCYQKPMALDFLFCLFLLKASHQSETAINSSWDMLLLICHVSLVPLLH